LNKNNKKIKYQKIRSKYQAKRRTKKWKEKKRKALINRNGEFIAKQKYVAKPYTNHKAPENMSFVDNTDEVMAYFNDSYKLFKKKETVEFDIKNITNLTPDTITLMIANLKDPNFTRNGEFRGEAPTDPKLKKLFLESGFYNFVATSKQNKEKAANLLHKETDYKVRPNIAKAACIFGMEHSLKTTEPFEPLYEILIECMQNTNNHASADDDEKCKWWLFVYNCKETNTSKYSFLDLGVGIFESIIVKNYITKAAKKIGALPNTHFVKDLLNGNIQSRIEKDNEIRGKGIPQIVAHSSFKEFKEFKIITNDVKIDLKNKTHEKLDNNFSGTFYYWEIKNIT
jgi:hypothetical protein